MAVLGWLMVVTPWTVRNYHHFSELMYVRGGFMLELWLGVCPEADAHGAAVYANRFPLNNALEQQRVASVGEQAYIKECARQAKAAIAADPWRFLRLVSVRAVDYWAGTIFSHARPGGGGWPREPLRAAIMLFVLGEMIAVAICLLVYVRVAGLRASTGGGELDGGEERACKRQLYSDLRWLLAIIASFSVVYCLTHVQIRFRAPTEPLVAIVLGASASKAWEAIARRRLGKVREQLESVNHRDTP